MKAQELIDAGMNLAAQKEINGVPITVLPKNAQMISHENLMADPPRVKRTVSLHDTESFIAYVRAFHEPGTVIFFDEPVGRFTALLDYHEGNVTIAEAADVEKPVVLVALAGGIHPRWCSHTAKFTPRATTEWSAWTTMNGVHMNQEAFAKFIEEHVSDIQNPEMRSALTAISLTLQIKKDVAFDSSRKLQSGSVELRYSESVEGMAANGTITIPATFTLLIQPFFGAPPQIVPCRFKYRLASRQAEMWYEIADLASILRDVLTAMRKQIDEHTGIWTLAGSAE